MSLGVTATSFLLQNLMIEPIGFYASQSGCMCDSGFCGGILHAFGRDVHMAGSPEFIPAATAGVSVEKRGNRKRNEKGGRGQFPFAPRRMAAD